MDFFQAVGSCFKKYATFSGRASRSEYWFFTLFQFVANFIAGIIDKTVLQDYAYTYQIGHHAQQAGLLSMILGVVFILPSLAVYFRRLHDVDRSGWWWMIAFTLVGLIFPLFYWTCSKGTTGDNRFGSDPLAGKQS